LLAPRRFVWRASDHSSGNIDLSFRNGAAACAVALCAAIGTASAHVVADPASGPSGGYFRTSLRVGHGCEGAATVAVRVRIPEGVLIAKPQPKPGWQVSVTKKRLDPPADNRHGGKLTEAVDEIAWRGGPLADSEFDEFGLSLKLPDRPAGETLWFPVVQECERGVHRWIEIPGDGQRWGDLREPAPFIRLTPPEPRR
jgi:uncharacterized protein YcnI